MNHFLFSLILASLFATVSTETMATGETINYDEAIDLEGVEKHFVNTLTKVAQSLRKKKLCMKIGRYITDQDDPVLKRIWYQSRLKNRKFKCGKFKDRNNEVSHESQDLLTLMVRLYNQLPLPFQCQVLTSTTVNYFEARRQEHTNEGSQKQRQQWNSIDNKLPKTKQTVKYNLMHHSKQLIESVEQVENLLAVHNILPVSKQCRRLVNKQNAFCKIFKLTVERNQSTINVQEIDIKLRETIPKIIERYARSNGIKIGLSLIDQHWLGKLSSLIFLTIDEVNSTSSHYVFHCKLFLALGNTGPINGNLALSALYDYGRERLSRKLGIKVDFSIYMSPLKHDSITQQPQFQEEPHFQQDLFMRQTFPKYLDRYFLNLLTNEQEFVLDLISVYSNQTRTELVTMLQRERGLELSEFLNNNRANRRAEDSHSPADSLPGKIPMKRRTHLAITQITNIEIIMITALSCLVIFGCVFVAVFVVFQKRRKEYNKRVLEIQNYIHGNTHVVIRKQNYSNSCEGVECRHTKSSSSCSDMSSASSSSSVTDKKGFDSFCTRTRQYSQYNNPAAASTMKVDCIVRSDVTRQDFHESLL